MIITEKIHRGIYQIKGTNLYVDKRENGEWDLRCGEFPCAEWIATYPTMKVALADVGDRREVMELNGATFDSGYFPKVEKTV